MTQERHLMGAWDCKHCGNTGITGTFESCPVCQTGRPADIEFYLPTDTEEITDEAGIEEAKRGPDWICGLCGVNNDADYPVCRACGTPKSEGKELETGEYHGQNKPHKIPVEPINLETSKFYEQSSPTEAISDHSIDSNERGKRQKNHNREFNSSIHDKIPSTNYLLPSGIGLLLMIAGWLFYYFFFATNALEVKVTGQSWERAIEVQRLETVSDEAWDEQVPFGARIQSSYSKIRDYEPIYDYLPKSVPKRVENGFKDVACGKEVKNNGNGTFTEKTKYCKEQQYKTITVTEKVKTKVGDTPIYDTRVRYEIDEWQAVRQPHSSGVGKKVSWPSIDLGYSVVNGTNVQERTGRKTEKYSVSLSSVKKNKSWEYSDFPYNVWNNLDIGSTFTAKVNRAGQIMSVCGESISISCK